MLKEFMITESLHVINSSLPVLPAALVFSSKLLLPLKSSATTGPARLTASAELLSARATKLTTVLKNIPGYYHGGLNE